MKEQSKGFWKRGTTYEKVLTACVCTVLCTIVFLISALAAAVGGFEELKYLAKFAGVMGVVERTYIGEADLETVTDAGFRAMIQTLGDRWSYYMTAEEYERYKEQSTNHYTGIGITLQSMEDGRLVIAEVVEDSPAAQAGLAVGMELTALDGEPVHGKTPQELSSAIREKEGTFILTALDAQGISGEYSLSLGEIYHNPVEYRMLDGQIGYIHLRNFDENCDDEAEKALDALLEQGAVGLIFDVRNNGGGYVTELTKLLDRLLPEGEIFVSVDEKGKEKVTTSDADCVDLPMAVLVNENTYSAAEFFAAALREYDAAVVVGDATTGKGRSQINVPLVDGSAVHISSRRYLTPNRVDLSEQGGIVPDIALPMGEEDDQLAAALEFVLTQG